MKYAKHPVVLIAVGVLIGYMARAQVSKIPGVSKLPSV